MIHPIPDTGSHGHFFFFFKHFVLTTGQSCRNTQLKFSNEKNCPSNGSEDFFFPALRTPCASGVEKKISLIAGEMARSEKKCFVSVRLSERSRHLSLSHIRDSDGQINKNAGGQHRLRRRNLMSEKKKKRRNISSVTVSLDN